MGHEDDLSAVHVVFGMGMRVVDVAAGRLHSNEGNSFAGPGTFRVRRGADHHILRKGLAIDDDILLKIIVPEHARDARAALEYRNCVMDVR